MVSGDLTQPKRRRKDSKIKSGTCIIHFKDTPDQNVTVISNVGDPSERFQTIKEICNLRQQQPVGSETRMDTICKTIPATLQQEHGYRRTCYQKFTNHIDRLKQSNKSEASTSSVTSKIDRWSSSDKILFSKDCIFCNKE